MSTRDAERFRACKRRRDRARWPERKAEMDANKMFRGV